MTRAKALKSDDSLILNNLGVVYLVNRKFGEAEKVLKKAYKLDPYMPPISNSLAIAYWELANAANAQHFIELAHKLDCENLDIQHNREIILGMKKGQLTPLCSYLSPLPEHREFV